MTISDVSRRYFDTEAASLYTSVSKKRLEKMRCVGGGPRYYKRGRSVFYSAQDLDDWMRAGAQCSTSESVSVAA